MPKRLLSRVESPATALIVFSSADAQPIAKGLRDRDALAAAVGQAAANCADGARVRTDVRASTMNPRRMEVIAGLAARLAQRLSTPCPQCRASGWGLLRRDPGLPCGDYGVTTAPVTHEHPRLPRLRLRGPPRPDRHRRPRRLRVLQSMTPEELHSPRFSTNPVCPAAMSPKAPPVPHRHFFAMG